MLLFVFQDVPVWAEVQSGGRELLLPLRGGDLPAAPPDGGAGQTGLPDRVLRGLPVPGLGGEETLQQHHLSHHRSDKHKKTKKRISLGNFPHDIITIVISTCAMLVHLKQLKLKIINQEFAKYAKYAKYDINTKS